MCKGYFSRNSENEILVTNLFEVIDPIPETSINGVYIRIVLIIKHKQDNASLMTSNIGLCEFLRTVVNNNK